MDCVLAHTTEGTQKSGSSTVGTVGEARESGTELTDLTDGRKRNLCSKLGAQNPRRFQRNSRNGSECCSRGTNPEKMADSEKPIVRRKVRSFFRPINGRRTAGFWIGGVAPEPPDKGGDAGGSPRTPKGAEQNSQNLVSWIPKFAAHDEGAQFTWIPPTNQRLRNMLKQRVTLEESVQFRV